jgi:hypothetical protein
LVRGGGVRVTTGEGWWVDWDGGEKMGEGRKGRENERWRWWWWLVADDSARQHVLEVDSQVGLCLKRKKERRRRKGWVGLL